MPLKVHLKGNEGNDANICWTLASEDARLQYIKQTEHPCERLYFPGTNLGTPKRGLKEKSVNDGESFTKDESLSGILIADQTLCTALRIHPEENEFVFASTKSKATHWPWLVECRSVFLNRETLSLCHIGNLL